MCLLVEFWTCTFDGPRASKHHPKSMRPPGFHTTAREPKRAHLSAPALQTSPEFHERTPRERERRKKIVAGGGKKKREILGPPPFGALRRSTLRGSTLRGSTFSRFGPPPFGAHFFFGPPFWAPHPSGAPPFVVQKFNNGKLAEVEIGRSRSPRPHLFQFRFADTEQYWLITDVLQACCFSKNDVHLCGNS